MKYRQNMFVTVLVLIAEYISGSHGVGSTILLPRSAQAFENTNLTLVCSFEGQNAGSFQPNIFQWILKSTDSNQFNVYVSNEHCNDLTGFLDFLGNTKLYSYRCINDTSHSVTLLNIGLQRHGEAWTCGTYLGTLFLSKSNNVTVRVAVSVDFSTISPNKSVFTISENSTSKWRCTSSPCRPEPKFQWYITDDNNSEGGFTMISDRDPTETQTDAIQSYNHELNITLTRTWNDRFLFCGASNNDENIFQSEKILLNVTYPPEGQPTIELFENGSELKVIKDGVVNLMCSIVGGNPRPSLEWNKNNDMPLIESERTVSRNITWQAIDINKDELRCQAIQFTSNYSTYVSVNVLYPPETPTIEINSSSGEYVQVNNTLHVIEGLPFTLSCSADSNPPVSLFQWNNLMSTNSSIYYIANADRRYAKDIACKVSNEMQASDSSTPTIGNNSAYLKVNVLYPPTMNLQREATIVEGDNLNNLCNFTPGNPPHTNITWSWNGITWNINPQQPYNVSRNQYGLYRCNVRNLMVSSDGTRMFGNASGEFNLSVQYPPKVLRFAINEQNITVNITVNENDAVNLTCDIEGLPIPTGQLHHRSFFNQTVEGQPNNLTFQISGNITLTASFRAQCLDTGNLTCSGSNTLYNGLKSTSNITTSLLVMCKPRMSPFHTIPDTVPSARSVDVTFSFTVLAYPVPPASAFVWAKREDTTNTWTTITTNENKIIISTWELQSNLTLKNVQQFDYGLYRILIDNGVGKFNHTFNLTFTVNTDDDTSGPSFNAILIAAGAAGGGFAILVAVIIVVVVYKRRQNTTKHISSQPIDFDIPKDSEGYMELILCEQQNPISNEHEHPPVLPSRQLTNKKVDGLQELDDYDENIQTDCGVYGNAYEMIKRIERVDVIELFPYISDVKTAEFFAADYAKLPHGLTKPYEFSQKPDNFALNRYHGIYPYDHSRVKIPSIPDYFINACYIDGYKRKKAYIASIGPLSRTSKTFVLFWQMVWSERSDVVVMLTKLAEPSGEKCEQYWPKHGTSVEYGDITVTSTREEVYSDYVTRTFSVLKGGQKRKLTHFQFMAWPDKSVPDDAACLLEFRRRIKANHTSGPMIVHCSAGIGRTGTFIAIDILIDEGQKKGSVNVLECVKTMREQRTNMVQTIDQYYYIFKALVNALVFDNEAMPAEKFHTYVESSKYKRFNNMFQKFNQSVESDNTKESNSRIAHNALTEKNRQGSDIPGDAHRARLVLNRGMQSSDYINAVYLNSFTVADHFIVAQSPLLNGVEDFLSLIYQEKCCCVVSMDGNLARQAVGSYLPPDNSSFTLGSFNVHCSRLDTKENYIVRELKIEITGQIKGAEKVVYHFQFLGWLDGNKVPNDPRQFVEFTEDVERFARQFGSDESHVLVHCLNAYERSCLFCAVVTLNEKIKHEKGVCVSNTLRQIRTRRKLAIPTLEQFKFCYQAVDMYINIGKERSKNAENAYLNVTIKV